jgi:hypothetical protein
MINAAWLLAVTLETISATIELFYEPKTDC